MTASLVGFVKVPPFEQVFPKKTKDRVSSDIGKFFAKRMGGTGKEG